MSLKSIYFTLLLVIFVITDYGYTDENFYSQMILNLEQEKNELQQQYPAEKVSILDQKSIRGKTYASRLKTVYSGIEEAKNLLENNEIYFSPAILNQKRIVFIDPGHGGKDKGATIPPVLEEGEKDYSLMESSLTFLIAQRVKVLLERAGYGVILTRSDEANGPSLYARSALCRASNADISISIHLNSTQFAYPVFEREDTAMPEINYSRVFVWAPSVYDLLYPFYTQIHTQIQEAGSRRLTLMLASNLARALVETTKLTHELPPERLAKLNSIKKLRSGLAARGPISRTTKEPVQDIPFDVLEKNKQISLLYKDDTKTLEGVDAKDLHMVRETPYIPAVLVEPVFLSAPEEQEKIMHGNRIDEIAKGVVKGIINYFASIEE